MSALEHDDGSTPAYGAVQRDLEGGLDSKLDLQSLEIFDTLTRDLDLDDASVLNRAREWKKTNLDCKNTNDSYNVELSTQDTVLGIRRIVLPH